MNLTIPKKSFHFTFKTPFRVLQNSTLDKFFGIEDKHLHSTDLLNFSLFITPGEKIEVVISLSEHFSFPFLEKTFSLLNAENMKTLSGLSICFDYNSKKELLDIALNSFKEENSIDKDYELFLTLHSSHESSLAFCCYPNLLKTHLCFNFFNFIHTNAQLSSICSEKTSSTELLRIFFPLAKNNSFEDLKSIFGFIGKESEYYLYNNFPAQVLKLFKNEDKFATFLRSITSFYHNFFGDLAHVSQFGMSWTNTVDYSSFCSFVKPFLAKSEHSIENFFINSIKTVSFEIESSYEASSTEYDMFDGQFDIFQLFSYYINDCQRTFSAIEDSLVFLDFEHPNFEKATNFHNRFLKKYRAKDLLSLHDDLVFHLNDLNDIIHGEQRFGNNEEIDPTLLYNYCKETIESFNFSTGNFDFKIAESSADLQFLGNRMRHCVASYHDDIANNMNHCIVGVFENDNPFLCLEIKRNEIVQAKKQSNRRINRSLPSDRELILALREYISAKKLLVNTSDLISLQS